jgi:Domain of unknown function (DUF6538)
MSRKDTHYLKQRPDGLWLIQVAVPRALRKKLGKDLIEKSLRTDVYRIAVRRRNEVLPIIRQAFERAKKGRLSDPDFNCVNLLVESDVEPQRVTIDDALLLAKAGEGALATAMLDKIMKQKRSEPDEARSASNGEIEFYRDGRTVVQGADGRWKRAPK